jgi:glutamate racemase
VLKPVIGEIMGAGVRLVDSAEEVAAEVNRLLDEMKMKAAADAVPETRFFATDVPERMAVEGERIWGTRISEVRRVEVEELASPKTVRGGQDA